MFWEYPFSCYSIYASDNENFHSIKLPTNSKFNTRTWNKIEKEQSILKGASSVFVYKTCFDKFYENSKFKQSFSSPILIFIWHCRISKSLPLSTHSIERKQMIWGYLYCAIARVGFTAPLPIGTPQVRHRLCSCGAPHSPESQKWEYRKRVLHLFHFLNLWKIYVYN